HRHTTRSISESIDECSETPDSTKSASFPVSHISGNDFLKKPISEPVSELRNIPHTDWNFHAEEKRIDGHDLSINRLRRHIGVLIDIDILGIKYGNSGLIVNESVER